MEDADDAKGTHTHAENMDGKIALTSRPAFTLTKSQYLSRHGVRSVKDFSALLQLTLNHPHPPPELYL